MSNTLVSIVRLYSASINNGRTVRDIYDHMITEVAELEIELDLHERDEPAGPDGIVGEAIDVIACLLDLIIVHCPSITEEDLNVLMRLKCQKWADKAN